MKPPISLRPSLLLMTFSSLVIGHCSRENVRETIRLSIGVMRRTVNQNGQSMINEVNGSTSAAAMFVNTTMKWKITTR